MLKRALLVVLFLVVLSSFGYSVTEISGCILHMSGSDEVYEFTNSIVFSGTSNTCLGFLNLDNIVVDCKGYTVDCGGNTSIYGMRTWGMTASDNVTIKNCVVKNCGDGIFIQETSGVTLENITVYNNTAGVYILSDGIASYGSSLFNNLTSVNNTQYGINFASCGINVTNSIIQGNTKAAFYFDATEAQSCTGANLTITDNSICYNNITYIESPNTTITTIANNTFCLEQSYPTDDLMLTGNSTVFNLTNVTNPINATDTSCYLYLDSLHNQTNSSVLNNADLFFSSVEFDYNSNHNWYVYCNDTNGNSGNSSVRSFSTINGITSCADWSSNNYYYLMNDIVGFDDNNGEGGTDGDANCFRAYNLVNNTFDCQGYSIGGDGNSSERAFGLWNGINTTIKNCVVSNFGEGFRGVSNINGGLIYLENISFQSNNVGYVSDDDSATQLTNVSFSGNNYSIGFGNNDNITNCNRTFQNVTMDGQEFWYWNRNTSGSLDIDANNLAGFYCCGCSNLVIENASNITGSYHGLGFYDSNNMTVRNISVYDSYYGFHMYNSSYCNFSDIFVNNSYYAGLYVAGMTMELESNYNNFTNVVSNYNEFGISIHSSGMNRFNGIITEYNLNRSVLTGNHQNGNGLYMMDECAGSTIDNLTSRFNVNGISVGHDFGPATFTNSVLDSNQYGFIAHDSNVNLYRPSEITMENVTMSNNSISGAFIDFMVQGSPHDTEFNFFKNITANNNTMYGIEFHGCNNTVSNSTFMYNSGGAFYFNSTENTFCNDENNTVVNSTICYNNASYVRTPDTSDKLENNTFCVDQSYPITGLALAGNSTLFNLTNVTNPINATDTSCYLYLNSSYNKTNSSVVDNGLLSFVSTMFDYNTAKNWYVYCNDTNGNNGNSSVWTFTTSIKPSGLACTLASECNGGYCVNSVCRSASTYCGDGVCDTGETCSSCVGDCDACDTTDTGGILYQCMDRIDNDNDGLVDMDDPGCDSRIDNDESDDVVVDENKTVVDIPKGIEKVENIIKEVVKGEGFEVELWDSVDNQTNKVSVVKKILIVSKEDGKEVTVGVEQNSEAPDVVKETLVNGDKVRAGVSGSVGIGEVEFNVSKQLMERINEAQGTKKVYTVYQYIEVETDVEIESAEIEFEVSKEWMESEGVDKDQVVLLHFVNGEWVELETEYLSGEDVLLFKAKTGSFSVFAVGVQDIGVEYSTEWYGLVVVILAFLGIVGWVLKGKK